MREDLTNRKWFVGVDLGQSQDPSAISVIERISVPIIEADKVYSEIPMGPIEFHVRHLERCRLGISYVAIAQHVFEMMQTAPIRDGELVVDMSGVGRPVVDLFRKAGLKPIGVTITAGASVSRDEKNPSDWRVSKLELVSRLQSVLHAGHLKIAAGLPDAKVLVDELESFQVTFTEVGFARFGARSGKHDDLVLAVAVAVWRASELHRRQARVLPFPFD